MESEASMKETAMATYRRWLECADEATKTELHAMKQDQDTLYFRFMSNLQFGTAGLRGLMGAGTNAMNVYTVAQATQGLAEYICAQGKAERGVAIAWDSRINSVLFAKTAAEVLAANGIPAYLFDELRPTPELSFALRHLGCIAGINITASHNPKEYNGYKAYWEDGAQISPEQAAEISGYIGKIDLFTGVRRMPFERAVKSGIVRILNKSFDEEYLRCVMAQAVNPDVIKQVAGDLKIVYTPLHGAGYRLAPEVLKRMGFTHIYPVKEQMQPNGEFPTVKNPNPEYKEVFTIGRKLADEVGSDLIVATDPDADRTGIMVRGADGNFVTLTGNQVGALLLDYIITALEETHTMPKHPYAVKSIVSTELATRICEVHNVTLHNVLTGFKFIGEVIKQYEQSGDGTFLFGFEESYGYLKGTYARDKDAIVATMLICEMAAYYKTKHMTLADALDALYARYGYYADRTIAVNMGVGLAGQKAMKTVMERLRANPPAAIGEEAVVSVRDYLAQTVTDLRTGNVTPTGLVKSDVLYYQTENGNVVVVRPSGTEPKVKLYLLLHGDDRAQAEQILEKAQEATASWLQ